MIESSHYDIKTEEIRFLVSAHESAKRHRYIPFSANLEAEFKEHYCCNYMLHRRLALWVMLVFVFVIGVLDLALFNEAWITLAPVKNAVIALAVVFIFFLNRSEIFDKCQYKIMVLAICVLSFVQAFSMSYLPGGAYEYYIPLFIASTVVAGVCMRVSMPYYLVTVLITWLAFNGIVVLLNPQPVSTQMAYNAYFILGAFLGGCLLLMLERGARKEYVKSRLISIERAELNRVSELLGRLDNVDPITGLSNAKHFNKSLGVEWHRSIRSGKALSVLMVEIDDFDAQVALLGQRFAEKYLFDVSKALTQSFKRAGDLIAIDGNARYLVMLPDVEQEAVQSLCERLHAYVAELSLTYPETDKPVTVTIGQATCVPDAEYVRIELLSWAEQALDKAKFKGEKSHAECLSNTAECGGDE